MNEIKDLEYTVKNAQCLATTGRYTRHDVGGKGGYTICDNKFEDNASCPFVDNIKGKNYCNEAQLYNNQ